MTNHGSSTTFNTTHNSGRNYVNKGAIIAKLKRTNLDARELSTLLQELKSIPRHELITPDLTTTFLNVHDNERCAHFPEEVGQIVNWGLEELLRKLDTDREKDFLRKNPNNNTRTMIALAKCIIKRQNLPLNCELIVQILNTLMRNILKAYNPKDIQTMSFINILYQIGKIAKIKQSDLKGIESKYIRYLIEDVAKRTDMNSQAVCMLLSGISYLIKERILTDIDAESANRLLLAAVRADNLEEHHVGIAMHFSVNLIGLGLNNALDQNLILQLLGRLAACRNKTAEELAKVLFDCGLLAKAGFISLRIDSEIIKAFTEVLLQSGQTNSVDFAMSIFGIGHMAIAGALTQFDERQFQAIVHRLCMLSDHTENNLSLFFSGLSKLYASNLPLLMKTDAFKPLITEFINFRELSSNGIAIMLNSLGRLTYQGLAGLIGASEATFLLEKFARTDLKRSSDIATALNGIDDLALSGLYIRIDPLMIERLMDILLHDRDCYSPNIARALFVIGHLFQIKTLDSVNFNKFNALIEVLLRDPNKNGMDITMALASVGSILLADPNREFGAGIIMRLINAFTAQARVNMKDLAMFISAVGDMSVSKYLSGDAITIALNYTHQFANQADREPREICKVLNALGIFVSKGKLPHIDSELINKLLTSLAAANIESPEPIVLALTAIGVFAKEKQLKSFIALDKVVRLIEQFSVKNAKQMQHYAKVFYAIHCLIKNQFRLTLTEYDLSGMLNKMADLDLTLTLHWCNKLMGSLRTLVYTGYIKTVNHVLMHRILQKFLDDNNDEYNKYATAITVVSYILYAKAMPEADKAMLSKLFAKIQVADTDTAMDQAKLLFALGRITHAGFPLQIPHRLIDSMIVKFIACSDKDPYHCAMMLWGLARISIAHTFKPDGHIKPLMNTLIDLLQSTFHRRAIGLAIWSLTSLSKAGYIDTATLADFVNRLTYDKQEMSMGNEPQTHFANDEWMYEIFNEQEIVQETIDYLSSIFYGDRLVKQRTIEFLNRLLSPPSQDTALTGSASSKKRPRLDDSGNEQETANSDAGESRHAELSIKRKRYTYNTQETIGHEGMEEPQDSSALRQQPAPSFKSQQGFFSMSQPTSAQSSGERHHQNPSHSSTKL